MPCTFEDSETGLVIRFDEGEEGTNGLSEDDHYHVLNPNATGRHDQYLDETGNPVRRGSDESHLFAD